MRPRGANDLCVSTASHRQWTSVSRFDHGPWHPPGSVIFSTIVGNYLLKKKNLGSRIATVIMLTSCHIRRNRKRHTDPRAPSSTFISAHAHTEKTFCLQSISISVTNNKTSRTCRCYLLLVIVALGRVPTDHRMQESTDHRPSDVQTALA